MEDSKINFKEYLQSIFVLVGGIYALYLLRRQSNRDKRNKFILEIIDRFFGDPEIRLILYSVDKGNDIDEIRFGGALEQQADKTLHYLDYLGRLLKQGDLKRKDINIFRYEIKRILESHGIQNYIDWLKKIGVNLKSLDSFDYLKN